MHARSFFLGWGAAVFALGCMVVGIVWFAHTHAHPLFVVTDDAPLGLEVESATFEGSTSTLPISFSTTGTKVLHEPPLRYLGLVKGDPKLSDTEVAIRVPVLMFHHIRPMKAWFTAKDRQYTITPEHFEAQMDGLVRAGYTTITPRELQAAIEGKMVLPEKSVLLTFDDGYREHYQFVLPILKRLHLKATYFIITSVFTSPAHMTKAMVKEADLSGLITIASHTRYHPFLARLSSPARASEIVGSKADLEEVVGHPVADFAYPFGSWNNQVMKDVEEAGYTMGFGIKLGSVHGESSRYQLRRIRVMDGENVVSLLDQFSKP